MSTPDEILPNSAEIAARYASFGDDLLSVSPSYAALIAEVAANPAICGRLAGLGDHSPIALLAHVRYLRGSLPADDTALHTWLQDNWSRVGDQWPQRHLQTNEASRCAALLADLNTLRGRSPCWR